MEHATLPQCLNAHRNYLHWHNVCHRDLKLENWVPGPDGSNLSNLRPQVSSSHLNNGPQKWSAESNVNDMLIDDLTWFYPFCIFQPICFQLFHGRFHRASSKVYKDGSDLSLKLIDFGFAKAFTEATFQRRFNRVRFWFFLNDLETMRGILEESWWIWWMIYVSICIHISIRYITYKYIVIDVHLSIYLFNIDWWFQTWSFLGMWSPGHPHDCHFGNHLLHRAGGHQRLL